MYYTGYCEKILLNDVIRDIVRNDYYFMLYTISLIRTSVELCSMFILSFLSSYIYDSNFFYTRLGNHNKSIIESK